MRILTKLLVSAGFAVLANTPLWANNVTLTEKDLAQVSPTVLVAPGLVLPVPEDDVPILGVSAKGDGVRLLRHLNGSGEINGFAGILYDNRDRDHSVLDPEVFPRLARLEYAESLVAQDLDYGLGGRIFMPAVVLGNSSTAMTRGPLQRSLPRLAMTQSAWREVTPLLYVNNHIYVYPEHRDYDREDRFPFNWPYMIVSQGSSGSDRAFLSAVAMTLAAFPADTFEALHAQRLVAPTVQMILRRTLTGVSSREDYLSGPAHPPAFNGRDLRPGRMVAAASEMRPDEIPPLARIRVIADDFATEAGLARLDERLLDSPSAVGRLWRGFGGTRELIVTAEDTVDPNGRPLSFEWRVLRGDPDRIRIDPQGPDGRSARIRVAWHDPWTETETRNKSTVERRLSRVDIGVFANNGVHDSAPALLSIDFPEHQIRSYADTPEGPRLVSIDYDARGRNAYFDPVLYWSAPWRDTARYDESGALLGWDRRQATGETVFVPLGEDRLPPELYEMALRNATPQATAEPETPTDP